MIDDFEINPEELQIDIYRAAHAGISIGRTDSAVRITHIPTGIVVQCDSEGSSFKNKNNAMEELKEKLRSIGILKMSEQLKKIGTFDERN